MTKTVFSRVGSTPIFHFEESPDVLFYQSGLNIDADGSPHAYGPNGLGLDYLANSGHPGNWWGVVAGHDGNPVTQANGYYVSTTSLQDASRNATDPERYVDSEKVPFIVLPSKPSLGAKLGDLAMILRPSTGDSSWAVFADTGPANQIGEGSIALANNLKVPSNPKKGGVESGIITILFKGTSKGFPKDLKACLVSANDAFKTWGGFDSVRAAFPNA